MQFSYLLEMIPVQNFNTAALLSKFLKECVEQSPGFGLETAGKMFADVYCRANALSTTEESEKKKGVRVTLILIEGSDTFFRETVDFSDKRLDRSREQRRKKEKEMMSSYTRSENKRVKKEEKKKEKLRKKQGPDNEGEVNVSRLVYTLYGLFLTTFRFLRKRSMVLRDSCGGFPRTIWPR
jgi:hypothetical protein